MSVGSICIVCVVKGGLLVITTIGFDQYTVTNICNTISESNNGMHLQLLTDRCNHMRLRLM